MSHVSHRRALLAPGDRRWGGAKMTASFLRSTALLSGFVLMGLLAALSGPTAASAEVTEPERALLGVVSTQAAGIRGNVAVARPSLSGGEAALLGKGSGLTLLASPSAEPAAVAFGDGAGAFLNHGPTRGHGTVSGRLIGTASVPDGRKEQLR